MSSPSIAAPMQPVQDRVVCQRLVRDGGLSEAALREAEALAATCSVSSIGHALTELGYLSERELADHYASVLRIDRVFLDRVEVDRSIARYFPAWLVERFDVIPLAIVADKCRIAMADPTDVRAHDELRMLTGFRGEVEVAERSEIRRKLLGLYGTSFSRLLAAREHQDPSSLPGELWDAAWRDMARLSAQTLRLSELDGAGTMQVTAWGKSWSEQIPAPLGRALAQELLRKLGITPGARPEAHRFRMPTLRLGVDCSVRPNPRGGTIFARTFKLDWLPDGPLARSPGGVAYAAVQPAYDLMERANEAWEEGDSERAEAEGRRALELADTPFGRTEPGFLELRAQVGMTAFLRGDYRGALAEQSVALERHAELLGLPDLGSARFQRWAGQSLLALGHVERARELITRALQTYEALVSPPDATLVAPLIDAGLCAWAHGGDLEAARVFFARARDSLPAAGPFTDEMSRRITRLLSRLEEGGPAPTGVAALMRDD